MSASESTQTALYRMVTDDHICPFGIKAKDLLERRGYDVEDHPLETREEADAFKEKHGVDTTPQVFIGSTRIGGYDALREHLGMSVQDDGKPSYAPVIAVFSVTFLMAIALQWQAQGAEGASFFGFRLVELFIAVSMCVLGILKLRDLAAFSNQFITYDLLARRVVRYAYVYPFAETFAGIGMLAGTLTPIVAPTALFIGTIGAVSVVKAVYVDRRELTCACVGGHSNVPLGFISLTENLMMVAMALEMLLL